MENKIKYPLGTCTVAVHDGPHHADDVFCVACMIILNPNIRIIRTRNKILLDSADFRIDVGGKYNPVTGDYDHHQEDFSEYHSSPNEYKFSKGPKLAGFGLIWRHFGKHVIEEILDKFSVMARRSSCKTTDEELEFIFNSIDNGLVASIDALDNGEQKTYYLDTGFYKMPTIIKMIQNYNPCTWIEKYDTEYYFDNAVDLAKSYLEREVIKLYGQVKAKQPLLEKVKECKDGYLILEEYLPWSPIFTQYPQETKDIKMVIFPSSDGWMFQSPYFKFSTDKDKFSINMPNGERRRQRYPAPQKIWGKVNQQLTDITGIKDAVFVHSSGFIGACKTKESAIEMAHYIVNNQDT